MANKRKEETVRTTLSAPEYQYKTWKKESDEMDASLGEYIRMMVQAGRRDLGYAESHSMADDQDDVESEIVEALREHDGEATWDELRDAVLGEIEKEVEDTVERLEQEGTIRTSISSSTITLVE